ncbi:MAG: hypothetical protein RIC85_01435 [Gammaproteobacteria bacterium]
MQTKVESDEFEIVIDFVPGEGDANRVFQAMSGLIEAFQSLDDHLLSTLDVALEAKLVLDAVEAGSLKARFRDLVAGIPDDALQDGNVKKIIGHFLLKSKYAVLRWLEDKTQIGSRDDVRVLEGELQRIAEETNINRLPAYSAPRPEALLSDIQSVQQSLGHLREGDTARYSYGNESVSFNRDLNISSEVVRDVLTKETISNSGIRIVKVKKPDYLGQSMWSLQYDGHAIDAKILDGDWLDEFQSRSIDVKPGDSLRVLLLEETSYGYEGEVVHRHFEIEKVYEVIRPDASAQTKIDF